MAVLGSTLDPDVLKLAVSLERVVTMIRRLPPNEGMSLTAISVLRSLEVSGPTRLTELAAGQGVTQPAMTQLVTRMERDGYLERRSTELDGRVVMVAITELGVGLMIRRRERRTEKLTALLATVPAADRDAILAATPALTLLADLGRNV
jgi:DNA-binding MarR family transcriptional regulator